MRATDGPFSRIVAAALALASRLMCLGLRQACPLPGCARAALAWGGGLAGRWGLGLDTGRSGSARAGLTGAGGVGFGATGRGGGIATLRSFSCALPGAGAASETRRKSKRMRSICSAGLDDFIAISSGRRAGELPLHARRHRGKIADPSRIRQGKPRDPPPPTLQKGPRSHFEGFRPMSRVNIVSFWMARLMTICLHAKRPTGVDSRPVGPC